MHNRLNKKKLPRRKALELGLQRRRVQIILLQDFITANPDYQIQLNFSAEGKPGNVCIKLTGIYAHKLLPLVSVLFEQQMKDIENQIIEIDTNTQTNYEH